VKNDLNVNAWQALSKSSLIVVCCCCYTLTQMNMTPRLTLRITEVAMALIVLTVVQMHARLLKVMSFRLQSCANDPIILFNPCHLRKLRLLVPPSVTFKRDDQF